MHNYLLLPEKRHEVLNGFAETDILAFGGGFYEVESTGTLKQVAGYIPAFPIYPPEFSWIRETKPEVGTIFAGTLETGSKVVYFAADIDRCFGREHLPDHRELLLNAVRYAAGGRFPMMVEGPGQLDCTIYRQPGRRIVHLVNMTGGILNPGYCEEIFPVGPVTVSLPWSSDVPSVRLTVGSETPEVRCEDGTLQITISKLAEHQMIVIEE